MNHDYEYSQRVRTSVNIHIQYSESSVSYFSFVCLLFVVCLFPQTGVLQFLETMRKHDLGYMEKKRKELGLETLDNEERLRKLYQITELSPATTASPSHVIARLTSGVLTIHSSHTLSKVGNITNASFCPLNDLTLLQENIVCPRKPSITSVWTSTTSLSRLVT